MSNEKVPLVIPTVVGFGEEHKKKEGKGYLVYVGIATALCMGLVANSNGIFTPSEANLLRSSTSDDGSDLYFAVSDNIQTRDLSIPKAPYDWKDRIALFEETANNQWSGVSLYAFQESKYGHWDSSVPDLISRMPGGKAGWDSVAMDTDPYPHGEHSDYSILPITNKGEGDPDCSIAWRVDTWTSQWKRAVKVNDREKYDKRSVVGACLKNIKSGKRMFFASYHGLQPGNQGAVTRKYEQEQVWKFMDKHAGNCDGNGLLLGDFNSPQDYSPKSWTRTDKAKDPYATGRRECTAKGRVENCSGPSCCGGTFGFDWGFWKGPSIDLKSAEFKESRKYTKSDHDPLELKFTL